MCIGVMLDMRNPNTLCTVGVLSALLEDGSRDYTDLISPFILAAVPGNVGDIVDLAAVQQTVRNEFGFEKMPLNFIRGVLNRYAKQDGYFKRKGPSYYVIRLFDKQAFVERRNQMRVKVDCVLTKMQSYFMENFANERLPIQTLRDRKSVV